jgi:hypothetical protein
MNAVVLLTFCLRTHHWLLPSMGTAIMLLARPSCDDVQLQAKEIQLLASTGRIARQKLMPAQQAPRQPGQRGDFQALAWLEVLGTTRTRSSNRDSASDSDSDWTEYDGGDSGGDRGNSGSNSNSGGDSGGDSGSNSGSNSGSGSDSDGDGDSSDSGNDYLQVDPWHHCFSAAGSAAAAMGHPLRLTALNVLLLDNLPNDVQLAHLVSALRSPPNDGQARLMVGCSAVGACFVVTWQCWWRACWRHVVLPAEFALRLDFVRGCCSS